MKLLIKQGRVVNPADGATEILDVLIDGSRIKAMGPNISDEDALTIDATNRVVSPGLVDVHVHLRQPGQEYKENLTTGSRAAAGGGFTTVIAEPNTLPPADRPSSLEAVLQAAQSESVVNFYSKAAISRGLMGAELTDIGALKQAGARAISDDGNPVPDENLMREALIQGARYGIPVTPHCEESAFYRKTFLQEGKNSGEDVPGKPYTSEDRFIARDIRLTEETGTRIHISHVSLARSVDLIARAKQRGVKITAEAAPHHFILTREMGRKIGPNAKVNPPLRSAEDVEAIQRGLANGTLDVIASDHAPHAPEEKSRTWDEAPFGVIGLETTLGLVLTYLVKPGLLTLEQALAKMTLVPARIFGLAEDGAGSLTPGAPADITIIDPARTWKVDTAAFYSKARNCPFHGWKLQGRAIATIVRGKMVMREGQVVRDRQAGGFPFPCS